jgi:hypothetical protein
MAITSRVSETSSSTPLTGSSEVLTEEEIQKQIRRLTDKQIKDIAKKILANILQDVNVGSMPIYTVYGEVSTKEAIESELLCKIFDRIIKILQNAFHHSSDSLQVIINCSNAKTYDGLFDDLVFPGYVYEIISMHGTVSFPLENYRFIENIILSIYRRHFDPDDSSSWDIYEPLENFLENRGIFYSNIDKVLTVDVEGTQRNKELTFIIHDRIKDQLFKGEVSWKLSEIENMR